MRFRGVEATHISFSSGFEVPAGLPGADRWEACRANHSVHAYVLEHDDAAPWLVNVHGVKQGDPTDMFVFRSGMHRERYGVNVVHPVLPMSGPRADRHSPQLPGVDLSTNVIGLAQAAWDVRRTLQWIRQRSDAPIILHGVSLGSYVVALVAGLDDEPARGHRRAPRGRLPGPHPPPRPPDGAARQRPRGGRRPRHRPPLLVGLAPERGPPDPGRRAATSTPASSTRSPRPTRRSPSGTTGRCPTCTGSTAATSAARSWDRGVKRYVDAAIADTVQGQLALA